MHRKQRWTDKAKNGEEEVEGRSRDWGILGSGSFTSRYFQGHWASETTLAAVRTLIGWCAAVSIGQAL